MLNKVILHVIWSLCMCISRSHKVVLQDCDLAFRLPRLEELWIYLDSTTFPTKLWRHCLSALREQVSLVDLSGNKHFLFSSSFKKLNLLSWLLVTILFVRSSCWKPTSFIYLIYGICKLRSQSSLKSLIYLSRSSLEKLHFCNYSLSRS